MPSMIINGHEVEFTDEKNILDVCRKAGFDLPTLCYQDHLSPFGACRMCVVDAGKRGLLTSCSVPPENGLEIQTSTERTRRVRKMSLELMLAAHDRECLTCPKSGTCKLQDYAERFGVDSVRFISRNKDKKEIDDHNPSIVRDPNKCILCGNCVRVCFEHQGLHILDFSKRGSNVEVGPAFGKMLNDVECIFCGQCATVCPTGAITVRPEFENVFDALYSGDKKVIFQVAPAVRVGLGELFGMKPGRNVEGKIVSALRKMGAYKVFDTNFAADLTIMEEATEFLKRLDEGKNLPLFTSCCPSWIKTAEQSYPELLPNLSSCRSPQRMFGSVAKKYFTKEEGLKPEDVFVVSVMPCSAKKFEAQREEFTTDGVRDVDAVITTNELARMIRSFGLDFLELPDEDWDSPLGESTGAAVIFGATGGVAEAALRTAYKKMTGRELENQVWKPAAPGESVREAEVDIDGTVVRIATVNGLAAARRLIDEIRRGEKEFHLVEIMACPAGCVGGAGQRANDSLELRAQRAKGLSDIDSNKTVRQSHNNESVLELYKTYLSEPNSAEAHHSLHTGYSSRRRIEEDIELSEVAEPGICVEVCVGTNCFQKGAYDTMKKLNGVLRAEGLLDVVDIKATFCFEKCGQSPNIAVNGKVIGNATCDRIQEIFDSEISPLLKTGSLNK